MSSESTQFKKGFTPWNKDKKGIHLSVKSEFKKGMIPWNKGKSGLYFKDINKPWISNHGYMLICHRGKTILLHRFIMENHLGRKLNKNESVHVA